MGIVSVDGVAHFAHLGGILVGIAILFCWRMQDKKQQKRGRENYWTTSTSNQSHYEKEEGLWEKLKQFFVGKRQPKMRVTNVREANYADHMYNERKRQESDEIDRILDKIRRNGYQNLSESEKATLFNASKRKQEEQGR